jgi:hypothetical protein
MKFLSLVFFVLLAPGAAASQEPDPGWDRITQAVWLSFQTSGNMVDNCALKIAHGVNIDRRNGWPAYCNDFENTAVVLDRIAELKQMMKFLHVSKKNLEKLSLGNIWIGAPKDYAILSWGRPKDINRTVTAAGSREQWVYQGGYLYIENGKVVAIQN